MIVGYNVLKILNIEDPTCKMEINHQFGMIMCGLNIKNSDCCWLGITNL